MSVYTTELRYIFDAYAKSDKVSSYLDIETLLNNYLTRLFNFDFPFYGDNSERIEWEKRFCRHFWMREIGCETVGLWKLMLQSKLCTIMPKYNQLYKIILNDDNLYQNINIIRHESINKTGTDTTAGTETNSGENNTTDKTKNVSRFSDTPQGALGSIELDNYLTSAKIDDIDVTNKNTTSNNSNSSNTTTYNTKNVHTYEETGYTGKTLAEMMEVIEKMNHIDAVVWKELGTLFMGVW